LPPPPLAANAAAAWLLASTPPTDGRRVLSADGRRAPEGRRNSPDDALRLPSPPPELPRCSVPSPSLALSLVVRLGRVERRGESDGRRESGEESASDDTGVMTAPLTADAVSLTVLLTVSSEVWARSFLAPRPCASSAIETARWRGQP